MTIAGIPAAALDFYEDLENDNSKGFWTEHKQIYDESVKAPIEELAAELATKFGPGKFFRPYRDVRFSKEKLGWGTRPVHSSIGEIRLNPSSDSPGGSIRLNVTYTGPYDVARRQWSHWSRLCVANRVNNPTRWRNSSSESGPRSTLCAISEVSMTSESSER